MLKKANRARVIKIHDSKRFSSNLFNLIVGLNKGKNSRFAFVVSKKVDKRATVRNSAKRKARSVIEEHLRSIAPGKDYIFYLKKEAISADRKKLNEEITKAVNKT